MVPDGLRTSYSLKVIGLVIYRTSYSLQLKVRLAWAQNMHGQHAHTASSWTTIQSFERNQVSLKFLRWCTVLELFSYSFLRPAGRYELLMHSACHQSQQSERAVQAEDELKFILSWF